MKYISNAFSPKMLNPNTDPSFKMEPCTYEEIQEESKPDEEEIKKDVKLAISQSSNVENAVEESNRKARKRQARRER